MRSDNSLEKQFMESMYGKCLHMKVFVIKASTPLLRNNCMLEGITLMFPLASVLPVHTENL